MNPTPTVGIRSLDTDGIPQHVVSTPCGGGQWTGMTFTEDLSIQVRKALVHVSECSVCREAE